MCLPLGDGPLEKRKTHVTREILGGYGGEKKKYIYIYPEHDIIFIVQRVPTAVSFEYVLSTRLRVVLGPARESGEIFFETILDRGAITFIHISPLEFTEIPCFNVKTVGFQ